MLSVGITGGIGSGKTTVCKIFQANWNIPVYYADLRAKEIMQQDDKTQQLAIELFGQQAYINHQVNTKHIAQIIFSNPELKKRWEDHIHSMVIDDYLNWRKNLHCQYHLHEAALIFEANMNHLFDKIILVTTPTALKIERLKAKGMSEEEAIQRINNQLPDYAKHADFYITNNEQQSLLQQIIHIHQHLTSEP